MLAFLQTSSVITPAVAPHMRSSPGACACAALARRRALAARSAAGLGHGLDVGTLTAVADSQTGKQQ